MKSTTTYLHFNGNCRTAMASGSVPRQIATARYLSWQFVCSIRFRAAARRLGSAAVGLNSQLRTVQVETASRA